MSDDLKKLADDMIKKIVNKLNDAKSKNADWGKTIDIIFSDIETGYAIKFAMDGSIEKIDKKPASEINKDEAEVVLGVQVNDLKTVLDGKVSSRDAMTAGMLQTEGNLLMLMKLSPAFER